MSTPFYLLLALAAVAFAWSFHRAAAEAAVRIGRDACAAAGVQWLDQSVQLTGIRIRRHAGGMIGLERTYRFDYSRNGEDRYRGRIVLLGTGLVELAGPLARSEPLH